MAKQTATKKPLVEDAAVAAEQPVGITTGAETPSASTEEKETATITTEIAETTEEAPVEKSSRTEEAPVQDPTRNPDTVEGSVFPQVSPIPTDVPAEKDVNNGPIIGSNGLEVDNSQSEEIQNGLGQTEAPVDAPLSADETVRAIDDVLGGFAGNQKLELILRIETVLKQHKSRM